VDWGGRRFARPFSLMDGQTLTCICGGTAADHYGKDHPFLEKRPDYDPSTWLRAARFAHEQLQPAGNLYITVEDRLRILILNQHGSTELDINARIQRPDGQVIPLKQAIVTGVSGSFQTFELDLTEGFLLDVLVSCVPASVKFGEIFVVVQLIRGASPNSIPVRLLLANYVPSNVTIGWPEGPNAAMTAGTGAIFTYQVSNPAAGADWTFTTNSGLRLLIVSLSAQLVTAVAVANRVPHLQVRDANTNIVFDVAASSAQAASLTTRYSWLPGVQPTINDGSAIAPIPEPLILFTGWQLRTVTTAIQAADQWQNVAIAVQQLLEF
jgi:hypothetical protein